MKKIALFVFCLMLIFEISLATEPEELSYGVVFFPLVPDRKTAEETLKPLLAEESWEVPVLPEQLSHVFATIFSCKGSIQEKCESLAKSLYVTKNDFEQQLDVLMD